jgi:hypothetical protein
MDTYIFIFLHKYNVIHLYVKVNMFFGGLESVGHPIANVSHVTV